MDRILAVGVEDKKFLAFLEKLGHELMIPGKDYELTSMLSGSIIDLIILDSRTHPDCVDLCIFFADQDGSKGVPILLLSDHRVHDLKIKEAGVEGVEIIEIPYAIGSVASRVATMLRLRKMAGKDETTATLAEMNAALRELNKHFSKELDEARSIQQSLLPAGLPKDPRYQIAASYEPLEEVGGDWYYVDTTPTGKLAVQIGDVTGHGLSAAFIGSMTKLAMIAADKELPHELLGAMNRLMAPNIPEGKFVTMFSYLYDPDTGELNFARAGHLPGFLLRAARGEVEQLMGEGFAVGFFEEAEYSEEATTIEVGDTLVILTDAIPESVNMNNEAYGFDRLSESMLKVDANGTVVDMLTRIIEDFEHFREGRLLKDDVTMVALKRVK